MSDNTNCRECQFYHYCYFHNFEHCGGFMERQRDSVTMGNSTKQSVEKKKDNQRATNDKQDFKGYKLSEIIKTAEQIHADGNSITNNIIEAIEVCVIGHFGNAVSLDIGCNNICAFHNYNNTSNIGYQIQALMELFDLTKEDGVVLSNLKKIPCRLIFKGDGGWGSECIGFGNFMKDKFVYKDDFAKVVGV